MVGVGFAPPCGREVLTHSTLSEGQDTHPPDGMICLGGRKCQTASLLHKFRRLGFAVKGEIALVMVFLSIGDTCLRCL
jgi:hypothetical protein